MPIIVPQLVRRRVVAAKAETTPGAAVSLANADASFYAYDPTIQPDAEMEERPGQVTFAPQASVVGCLGGTAKFKTEIFSTGAVPTWASTLFAGAGLVFTSLVAKPVSRPPSVAGVKTLTIGFYEDEILKSIYGAVCSKVSFTFPLGKRVIADWEFKGIWAAPADTALLTPTYPTAAPLQFLNAGLSIGGTWVPRVSAMQLDITNKAVLRPDATTSGYLAGLIDGRTITGKMDPESNLVANNNLYGQWAAGVLQTLSIVLGAPTNQITFASPKMQYIKPQEGERDGLQKDDVDFMLIESVVGAGDELSITFA